MTDQTNIHTNDVPTGFKIGGFTFGSRRNSALKTPKAATTSGINGNAHGGSGGNYSPSSSNQKLGQSPSVSSFRNMGRSASKTSINSVSVNTSLDSDLEINGSSHKASRNNSTQLSAASPAACLHHTNNHVSAPDLARIHIELEEEEGGEDVVQGRISTIDDDNNGGGDGGGGRVEIIEALEDTINTTTQEGGMKSKRNSIQKPSIKSMVLDLFKSSYKDHLLDSCLSPIEANSDNIPGTSSSRRNSRTSLSRLSRTAATSSSTENNNINPSNPSSTAVLSRSNSKKKSNATSNSLIHNDFNHLSLLDFSLREETMSMEELGGPTVRKTSASTNALSPSSKFFGESTPNIQRSLQEQGHQHQQQQSSANHNNHTTLESAGNTSLPDIGKSTLAAASSTTHSIAASSSTSLLSPSPLNAYAPQHLSLMDIHGHHSTQTHPSPSNTLQPLHGRQTSDSKRGSLKVVTFNPPSSFTSATTNRRRSSAKSGDLQPSSGSSSRINTIIQEYTIPSAESPLHGTLTMWCDDDDVGVNTFQYAAGGTGGVGGQLVDVEVNNEFVVVRQAVPLLGMFIWWVDYHYIFIFHLDFFEDEIQEVLNKKNVVEIVSMPVGASCIALASNSNDSNKGGSDNNNSTFIVIVGHERYSFRASSEYDAVKS